MSLHGSPNIATQDTHERHPVAFVYSVDNPRYTQQERMFVRKRGWSDFLGIEGRTWFVVARFVGVVFIMSLIQIWTDSQPRPDAETCRVSDTFFMIIPNLPRVMSNYFSPHVADLWIAVQLGFFFAWIYYDAPDRQLWVRRWFALWTYGYGLRAFTVGLTHYLPPEFKDHAPFAPDNPFYGALLIVLQLRSSLADLMFSGHTITWVMSSRFVWYHSSSNLFRHLYALGAIVGPILLVAVREHYSADVLIAVLLGWLLFSDFYLWYVRHYRERWIRIWEVEVAQPTRIVYPVTLTMADGTTMVIGEDRAGQVELVGAHVTPDREQYMRFARYLYADEIVVQPNGGHTL